MHAPGKSKTKSYKFALKLIIMNCGERTLLVPRERAVRTYIMADEPHEPGGNAITSTLFGQTSSQAVAAAVQTVQIHSDGLGEAHVGNAVGLLSAISSKERRGRRRRERRRADAGIAARRALIRHPLIDNTIAA